MSTRTAATALLTLIDEGLLTPQRIAEACLAHMSEDQVTDMIRANAFFLPERTAHTLTQQTSERTTTPR